MYTHLARSRHCVMIFIWSDPNRYAIRTSISEIARYSATFATPLLTLTCCKPILMRDLTTFSCHGRSVARLGRPKLINFDHSVRIRGPRRRRNQEAHTRASVSGLCCSSLDCTSWLSKLMARTTKPSTSSKWINAPPICKLKPNSHKPRPTSCFC